MVLAHQVQTAAEEQSCLSGAYVIPWAMQEHLTSTICGMQRGLRVLSTTGAPQAQGTDPGLSDVTSASATGLSVPPDLQA